MLIVEELLRVPVARLVLDGEIVVVGDAWLAQMGVVELHTFLGRLPDLERPRTFVLDLDPGGAAGLLEAAEVALLPRERLAARGLEARVKTS